MLMSSELSGTSVPCAVGRATPSANSSLSDSVSSVSYAPSTSRFPIALVERSAGSPKVAPEKGRRAPRKRPLANSYPTPAMNEYVAVLVRPIPGPGWGPGVVDAGSTTSTFPKPRTKSGSRWMRASSSSSCFSPFPSFSPFGSVFSAPGGARCASGSAAAAAGHTRAPATARRRRRAESPPPDEVPRSQRFAWRGGVASRFMVVGGGRGRRRPLNPRETAGGAFRRRPSWLRGGLLSRGRRRSTGQPFAGSLRRPSRRRRSSPA